MPVGARLPESGSVSIAVALDRRYDLQDIAEALFRVSHTGCASRRTRSRIRAFSPRTVTTSTWHPNKDSSSYWSPPRSSSDLPGSISTRKSTSLFSSASPRVREPNTRILRAPYFERCAVPLHASPGAAPQLSSQHSLKGFLDEDPLPRRPTIPKDQQPRPGL
jgi:hypothetical protein